MLPQTPDRHRVRHAGRPPGPALVVAGERDPFGPTWPAAWSRLLPQARTLVVPGSGHMPVLEQPGAVLPALREVLDSAA